MVGGLTPQAEAQVRATFERWHRDTCRLTGDDPTVVVSRHRYAEAKLELGIVVRVRPDVFESDEATPSRNGYALYNWRVHFDVPAP